MVTDQHMQKCLTWQLLYVGTIAPSWSNWIGRICSCWRFLLEDERPSKCSGPLREIFEKEGEDGQNHREVIKENLWDLHFSEYGRWVSVCQCSSWIILCSSMDMHSSLCPLLCSCWLTLLLVGVYSACMNVSAKHLYGQHCWNVHCLVHLALLGNGFCNWCNNLNRTDYVSTYLERCNWWSDLY